MYRRGDLGAVARALRVLDGLRGFKHGRALAELAEELAVSEKTIRRDLADLEDAGFEIELVRRDGRAAARLVEHSYSHIAITRRERYTLLAVRRVFDVLRGTPLAEDIESVQRKLEQRMTREERDEHASDLERFAYVPDGGTKLYDGKEDVLDALQTGVLSRRVVRFSYQSPTGRSERGYLAPFAIVLYKQGLYVLGRRLRRPEEGATLGAGAAVVLAVERFVEAEHMRGMPVVPPVDFKIGDYVHGAFGIYVGDPRRTARVVIEFTGEKSAYVRGRVWHPEQCIEDAPGGGVRLSFPSMSLTPLVSWVLSWGPHARAIEPAELVAAVVAELDSARANYPRRDASGEAT